ncbi:MAG TPA: c-type cytochrome [Candidatus Acidoferrales bacterium]|nr:c-type cytochrome [Candidatus Acidoferrales bacterium]
MIAILVPILLAQLPPVAQLPPIPGTSIVQGQIAYLQFCASCHGVDLRGGANAPSIRGAGAAEVDFWLTTGRMPAAVPWIEVGDRGPQLSAPTIDSIIAYVTSVQPGGQPIPPVFTGGNVAHGRALFRLNCMPCHGADAQGAAIGSNEWAPSLDRAPVTQIAEAIRLGPSEMPSFGEQELSPSDVDDIVTYISDERAQRGFDGLPVTSSGPVPEGLLGWIAAGILAVFARILSLDSGKKGS